MKPILYVSDFFKAEQVAAVKKQAPAYQVMTKQELTPEQRNAVEIMLGWEDDLGAQLLADADSRLQWIQTISAGVDRLDLSTLAAKSIQLSNASGVHSMSITEHVLGVLLSYFRGLQQSVRQQVKKQWATESVSFQQLAGKKMLVVGTGQIGQQLAHTAEALQIQSYGVNTTGHAVAGFKACYPLTELTTIASEMDIIVNILPLTTHTHHLYNHAFFKKMAPHGVFVNVGRGPSVDTNALVQALETKELAFAALDVFEEEPLPPTHPLWNLENVLITPHIAGHTPDYREKVLAIFLANLATFQAEKFLSKNQVSLTKGY